MGPILKGQGTLTLQDNNNPEDGPWPFKMGPIGSPETSVLNNLRRVITQKTEEFRTTWFLEARRVWQPKEGVSGTF